MDAVGRNLRHRIRGTLSALAMTVAAGIGPAGADQVPEWRGLLEKIVSINSGTRNVEGLDAVRQVLVPEFEKLGMEVTVETLADGHKLLWSAVPGSDPEILFMGHIDTVFPKDSPFQQFEIKGDRIYGPGIIDMKGGIVLMIDLLKAFKETNQLDKFMVIINDDEEIGSPYSNARVKELASRVRSGLVFEPGLPDGAVVTSHAGVHWVTLTVEGKAAHAGLEPQNGISACVELSDKVGRLSKLSEPDKNILVNVGVIKGGTKPNVVCETAEAGIDIRFVEQDDLEQTLKRIQTIADEMVVYNELLAAGPTASLETVVNLPSMPPARSQRLYELLEIAGEKTGQRVSGQHVGYGSDGGTLAEAGIDVLVGVGPYGGGMHTDDEFLVVSTYEERRDLAKALIEEMLK